MAVLDGLATYLDGLGLVDYDSSGVTGNLFLETLPSTPDEAVALTIYGGREPDSKLGYDSILVQVRVRGTPDPRISRATASSLYSALSGLGPVTLADGTLMILATALQPPFSLGRDANGRFEHVFNLQLEVRNITAHRV